MSYTETDTIAIRRAIPADAGAVRRLAALDSADIPAGTVLLAEVDGDFRAAISLTTGAAIGDPFALTADLLLVLLRLRAAPARRGAGRRGAPESPSRSESTP